MKIRFTAFLLEVDKFIVKKKYTFVNAHLSKITIMIIYNQHLLMTSKNKKNPPIGGVNTIQIAELIP